MNQPLGMAVGNSLELREAIETLRGSGPADFREHCLKIGGYMLYLGNGADSLEEASHAIKTSLQDGSAFDKFLAMVGAQGGDVSYVENPELLPKAAHIETFESPESGYLSEVHAGEIGLASVGLGAGRLKKGDPIDHAVGIIVHRNVGDQVQKGETLFEIHASSPASLLEASERVMRAHRFLTEPTEPIPHFYKTLMD
jgi:pyrimidine-nucleoside phosphorylase